MPYFIAYSAYVAITILIRVSAQLPKGNEAQIGLHICLGILADSEKTNAGVKRASFVVSKLLFAIARGGPNPFPETEVHRSAPWGETVNDKIELSPGTMSRIISTFSTTSPDAAAEQSQLEVHPSDPGIQGPFIPDNIRGYTTMDSGTAAQLLASLRTNTPAQVISSAPSPKIYPGNGNPAGGPNGTLVDNMMSMAFLPDTIFGLHNDESFQSWPDFNDHLETLLYGGGAFGGLGPEQGGGGS